MLPVEINFWKVFENSNKYGTKIASAGKIKQVSVFLKTGCFDSIDSDVIISSVRKYLFCLAYIADDDS